MPPYWSSLLQACGEALSDVYVHVDVLIKCAELCVAYWYFSHVTIGDFILSSLVGARKLSCELRWLRAAVQTESMCLVSSTGHDCPVLLGTTLVIPANTYWSLTFVVVNQEEVIILQASDTHNIFLFLFLLLLEPTWFQSSNGGRYPAFSVWPMLACYWGA